MKARWLVAGLACLCLAPPAGAKDDKKPAAKSFKVPYRLTDASHILVRVKINGKGPYNFIIDTGAPALFVATSVCKKLGIEKDKNGWGTFDRFEIEGGVVETKAKGRVETPFQIEGMNALGIAGADLHGIIGYNLLARYRMEFDFTQDKLTWTRLDFDPGLPRGIRGNKGAPGGLEALGGFMKILGAFIGKKPRPRLLLRGFLGLELAAADKGLVVKSILARGPADQAGLKAGDRVTHFQGTEIESMDDIKPLIARLRAGQTARFTVTRQGKTERLVVKVGEGL
jgi:hypothetical protein